MSLQVYTARIGCKDPDALNVSRKSGTAGLFLAPSWKILGPSLNARAEAQAWVQAGNEGFGLAIECEWWAAYVPLYLEEMRVSYGRHREKWEALLAKRRIVLCCYCAAGRVHCHRGILAEKVLPKLGATDCGELVTEPGQRGLFG